MQHNCNSPCEWTDLGYEPWLDGPYLNLAAEVINFRMMFW